MKLWLAFGPVLLVLSIIILFLAAGCGEDKYKVEKIGGGYSIVRLPYQGGFVTCIKMHFGGSDQDAYGGLSCDFDAFHRGQ